MKGEECECVERMPLKARSIISIYPYERQRIGMSTQIRMTGRLKEGKERVSSQEKRLRERLKEGQEYVNEFKECS